MHATDRAGDEVFGALLHLTRQLKSRVAAEGADSAAVVLLHRLAEAGSMRTSDLANGVALDHSTVSRHVARLEQDGRVSRTADPGDGRASRIELTAKGRQSLEDAMRRRGEVIAAALRDWTDGDRATLAEFLHRFAAALALPAATGTETPREALR